METLNKINLKEEFLKMYVKEATAEQLEQINSLLEQGDYKQIDRIVEEYTQGIINNKDLKSFGENGGSPFGGGMPVRPENEDKTSTEDMDPQTFELYCILMLINEYEKEQNQDKKKLLEAQIQAAIERYRTPEEVKTGKSR